ncbi:winged helix-turn-helix domain-containing protein [Occallatibacter riparius]|uniref:Winged helix-turn-helix domain-containing protein n=1 Tax=Occallatibacter riparius TaxID=1002689 RepID=A0A9J7BQD6_9BACT|nr:winged helix-turn-helix domain-containing protein [Occallatibacter riparius]UWZ84777.1 winged helix-turn-helix domain-containing protein [Occallatibacter riparius]
MTPSDASVSTGHGWHFGVFEVDTARGELRRSGIPIKLRDQSFQILLALLEHPGQIVTREELRRRLWPSDTFVDFDHSLNTAMMKLRDALGDSTGAPIYIETIPRHGYRFIAPVTSRDETKSLPGEGEAAVLPAKPEGGVVPISVIVKPSSSRKPWLVAAVVIAAVAAILFGLNVIGLRDRVAAMLGNSRSAAPPRIQSIAVLPFENLSGDQSQEYFADGMTEELITELGAFSGVRVISRTSVMRFKDTKMTLPEVARELGADGVLEGTVARSGNRVRVTATLRHAATDHQLWASRYETEVEDMLIVQNKVARSISDAIRSELAPPTPAARSALHRVNPEAYQAYLEGRYQANKWTDAGFEQAEVALHRSIDLDPTFAPAYTALANVHGAQAVWGIRPATEVFPAAKYAALKAIELDDGLAEAHAMLGAVKLVYDWDWAGAEQETRRAVLLNPSSVEARTWYGIFLTAMGRHDEALREGREMVRLDPLAPTSNLQLAWQLHWARRHDEAISQIARVIELDPHFAGAYLELGWNYAAKGMYSEAVTNCRRALDMMPDDQVFLSTSGRVYALAGKRQEAFAQLARLQRLSRTSHVDPWYIAVLYDGAGDTDKSIEYLQRAYSERSGSFYMLKVVLFSERLRSDDRFQVLLKKLSFPS